MLRKLFCSSAVILLLLSAGCALTGTPRPQESPKENTFSTLDSMQSAELRQRAENFTQAMFRSFNSGDFSHWKNFLQKESAPGKSLIVDERRFHEMRQRFEKSWGKLVQCHYLGSLDQSVMRDFIWKCTFESPGSNGKTVRLEELFVVRCAQLKGKTIFTNFGFRFFNRAGFREMVIKLQQVEEREK
jgi:hypothetical protein